jgi:hypothetical protein
MVKKIFYEKYFNLKAKKKIDLNAKNINKFVNK